MHRWLGNLTISRFNIYSETLRFSFPIFGKMISNPSENNSKLHGVISPLSAASDGEYLTADYPRQSYSQTYPKDNKHPQMAHLHLCLHWYLDLVSLRNAEYHYSIV